MCTIEISSFVVFAAYLIALMIIIAVLSFAVDRHQYKLKMRAMDNLTDVVKSKLNLEKE